MVNKRLPSNPAVGILREQVIIGFFVSEFGIKNVNIPKHGTERGYDVILCGEELSIKTVTNDTSFKILWTVDTDYVIQEMNVYEPKHDLFLVNIFWGQSKESAFYIPLSAQNDICNFLGVNGYLSSATKTNNRGIEIRKKAVTHLKNHSDTISITINWNTSNSKHFEPWEEWETYWRNIK
ncbi:MAG: ThaI family type II restriction endonuclease [Gammaproteobacteria bacterium]|nr:ThaI family type II restriction endonuclease [Gammaproteobacteria bacterium]